MSNCKRNFDKFLSTFFYLILIFLTKKYFFYYFLLIINLTLHIENNCSSNSASFVEISDLLSRITIIYN